MGGDGGDERNVKNLFNYYKLFHSSEGEGREFVLRY